MSVQGDRPRLDVGTLLATPAAELTPDQVEGLQKRLRLCLRVIARADGFMAHVGNGEYAFGLEGPIGRQVRHLAATETARRGDPKGPLTRGTATAGAALSLDENAHLRNAEATS